MDITNPFLVTSFKYPQRSGIKLTTPIKIQIFLTEVCHVVWIFPKRRRGKSKNTENGGLSGKHLGNLLCWHKFSVGFSAKKYQRECFMRPFRL